MKRNRCLVIAAATMVGVVTHIVAASGQSEGEAAPIYGIKIPSGYRDWRLISVNHLAGGSVKQVRAQLGNDVAVEAFRAGKLPFPLDYSGEMMHAALDVNMPNYANAIVTANGIVDAISSLQRSGLGAPTVAIGHS
jgi:hypothetical protein